MGEQRTAWVGVRVEHQDPIVGLHGGCWMSSALRGMKISKARQQAEGTKGHALHGGMNGAIVVDGGGEVIILIRMGVPNDDARLSLLALTESPMNLIWPLRRVGYTFNLQNYAARSAASSFSRLNLLAGVR